LLQNRINRTPAAPFRHPLPNYLRAGVYRRPVFCPAAMLLPIAGADWFVRAGVV